MGFLDKLQDNMSNLSSVDPLFGGLIPRRIEEDRRIPKRREVIREVPQQRMMPSLRQNDPLMPPPVEQGIGNRNIVFNWDEQKINLAKKALELEGDKFRYDQTKDEKEFGFKGREQNRKELEDRNKSLTDKEKLGIDHRKQALEEWKARNPEGEIKVDENGKLHVINKQTGSSIDTGLIAEHFDDKEKLNLQQKHAIDLEKMRQEGREKIEGMRGDKGSLISPTQQRAAEDDAFQELLTSGEFDDIKDYIDAETGEITPAEDSGGFLGFGKSDPQNTLNVNNRLDEFKTRLQEATEARMNKRIGGSAKLANGMIVMIDPKGVKRMVPEADVDRLKALGGKVEGEEETEKPVFDSIPTDKVSDDIELTYNDKGKVIGARNKKAIK